MSILLRLFWLLANILFLLTIVYFLLGATSRFNRFPDVIETTLFTQLLVPLILIFLLSMYLRLGGWHPTNFKEIALLLVALLIGILISANLIKYSNPQGWVTEKVTRDTLQETSDGKYEYNIELVNLFQRNSYARLYLKNTSTGEEIRILLDMPIKSISYISNARIIYWSYLEPIPGSNKYLLRTTKDFPFPDEVFEIDIKRGGVARLE